MLLKFIPSYILPNACSKCTLYSFLAFQCIPCDLEMIFIKKKIFIICFSHIFSIIMLNS